MSPERLSYKRGKAYATMSKVIMGNGGFYGCLSEPQGVSAWWKQTAQTRLRSFSFLVVESPLTSFSKQAKLLLPIMPIGIVAYAFTLSWDNLCRNSCILIFVPGEPILRSLNHILQWKRAKTKYKHMVNYRGVKVWEAT